MTRGRQRGPRSSRQAASTAGRILVFGESRNDADSVARLLQANNPALARRVQAVPRPTSLTRTAGPQARGAWIDRIAAAVQQFEAAGRPVSAVVVHQDADGPDPQGLVAGALTQALAPVGGHAVVPVQMTEAWWFLYPDAVEAVRPHVWRGVMPRSSRAVESIAQPKTELQRLTRSTGREYTEADSAAIADKILDLQPRQHGDSPSYDRLTALALTL